MDARYRGEVVVRELWGAGGGMVVVEMLARGLVGAARTLMSEEGAEVAVKGGEEAMDGLDIAMGNERGTRRSLGRWLGRERR